MIPKLKAKIEKILQIPVEDCDLYFSNSKIPLKIPAKDYFLKQGQICKEMAFIENGELRMFYITEEGKEINVEFFFENNFVASYQSFLHQSKSKYYIQAISDCELITISNKSLQNAYSNSPYWQRFGRIIAEKVFILAEQRSEGFLFYDAQERYLNLLKNRPVVFEKIPLYHIASYLGIEPESLSRLRKKLFRKNELNIGQ
ncbi:Crp/Fnr family transcriptional regulator [Maribacter stanieri]|uniref:Crp/Fnr family transcriptional regulator n=1 Tax=Maribacter stanieri TaxID=440514 RepID=UPI0030DCF2E5|tara:strand:- start:36867 stop:37469 length:603 start_codon:yes stop_codon:yes gene_type:complete